MQIKVTIDTDGTSQVEVNGVKGKKCTDITKELEKALGVVVKSTKTNEYYEKEEAKVVVRR